LRQPLRSYVDRLGPATIALRLSALNENATIIGCLSQITYTHSTPAQCHKLEKAMLEKHGKTVLTHANYKLQNCSWKISPAFAST